MTSRRCKSARCAVLKPMSSPNTSRAMSYAQRLQRLSCDFNVARAQPPPEEQIQLVAMAQAVFCRGEARAASD